jgi:hypothetical protein
MRRANLRAAVLAAACLAAASAPISATIVLSLDLVQLVQGADLVVCGRVVDVSAVRMEGRYSDSLVTLEPAAVLKGSARGSVVFRVPGGETGRFRTIVVGAPVLHVDDEVVVFLAGDAPQVPHVVGFSQGVLPLMRDDTGRAVLLAPAIAPGGVAARAGGGSRAARVMTLSAFADDVRAIAAGLSGAGRERVPAGSRKPGSGGPGRP